MDFKALARRKFIGVPLIYWALAAVTILAYVAWKLKPVSSGPDEVDTGDVGSETGAAGDLSALNTTGTVVVQPTTQPVAEAEEETNEKWLRAAVNYLVSDAKVATVGEAQLALATYLDGGDLDFNQGSLRDKAVLKLGLPPEGLPGVGKTSGAPARKQFSNFPGKHTVKGSSDNTPAKISQLYYGTADDKHVNRLVELNTKLGPATTTYQTGTVVNVPVYTLENYYTVTGKNKDQYFTMLAGKFGLTVPMLQALNPTLTQPIPIGTKVRSQ